MIGFTNPMLWWNVQPSLPLYYEFERDASGKIIDPRAYLGLWIPDGASFYDYTSGDPVKLDMKGMLASKDTKNEFYGKWFGVRKYGQDDNSVTLDAQRSGFNDRILRYADALLMYAECCLETGDEATALQYINMVRARANNKVPSTPSDAGMFYVTEGGKLPTAEQVIAAAPTVGKVVEGDGDVATPGVQLNTVRRLLKHEYSVELFMEGWRFFNVMRWYNNPNDPDAASVIQAMVDKPKWVIAQSGLDVAMPFSYDKNRFLAVPNSELTVNPNMIGNSAN
jgi:hypothetical protein